MDNITQIRNRYRKGDISVYPLIIESNHPDAGRIKIVSAKKFGKWMEVDHYGENPMDNWGDVFQFLSDEVEKLKQLNVLSYISRDSVREFWEQINPPANVINSPNPDDIDNLVISHEGVSSLWNFIDNGKDDPRFEKGYWEPILLAWENSLKKLQDDFDSGILINIED